MCSSCIWSIYLSVDPDIPEFLVLIIISLIEVAAYKETATARFLLAKLKSSLRKYFGHHHDAVSRYGMSVLQITTDMFYLS